MRGVENFRSRARGFALELHILSAGYGFIRGGRKVAPYECTFATMNGKELKHWAEMLHVPESFRRIVAQRYEIAIVLLGNNYLEACALAQDIKFRGPTLLFCGAETAAKLPHLPNLRAVTLSDAMVGLEGRVSSAATREVGTRPRPVAKSERSLKGRDGDPG